MVNEKQIIQKILRDEFPRAAVDFAYQCFVGEDHSFLLLLGWARLTKGERLFIVGKDGAPVLLTSVYFTRKDIRELYGPCFNPDQSGYGLVGVAEASPVSGELMLVMADASGVNHVLSFTAKTCYGIQNLLNLLFELPIPDYELKNVFATLLPELGFAFARNAEAMMKASLTVEEVGQMLPNPQFSLLVGPVLEGEALLTQLLAFADDKELKADAELIYILDDTPEQRSLTATIRTLAGGLRVPCKIVWITCSTQATVIWNCASRIATGSKLVFLRSDTIPESPGWLSLLGKSNGAAGSASKDVAGLIHSGLFITGQGALIDSHTLDAYYGGSVLLCPRDIFFSLSGFNPAFQFPETAFMDFHRRIRAAEIAFHHENESMFTTMTNQRHHKKALLLDLLFFEALKPAPETHIAAESLADSVVTLVFENE